MGGVFATYFCVTNYLKALGLPIIHIWCLTEIPWLRNLGQAFSGSQELGQGWGGRQARLPLKGASEVTCSHAWPGRKPQGLSLGLSPSAQHGR